MFEILLPFPPSVNHYLGTTGKRRFRTAKTKRWLQAAEMALQAQCPSYPTYTTPVELTLAYGRPDRRKRDLLNYDKILCDWLQEIKVIEDDSLIHRAVVYWDEEARDSVFVTVRLYNC